MENNCSKKIPKVIHYCWFGGKEIPKENRKCIESWKRYLSDYEIVEWNESNFDVNIVNYTKEAYKAKKYAFVSDYARFYILYNFGGIYMDTDVEVIKPFDSLLDNKMFGGFEGVDGVNPGLILGSIKETKLIKELLDSYDNKIFIKGDGSLNTDTVVKYTTDILINKGFILNGKQQIIDEMKIYPPDYFCPIDYKTHKITITENTYTIHHFSASWHSNKQKIKTKIRIIFGERTLIYLSKIKRILIR